MGPKRNKGKIERMVMKWDFYSFYTYTKQFLALIFGVGTPKMRWDGWRARDVGTEIGGGVVSNSQNRWEKVSSEKNCCYSLVEWSESIFSSEKDFESDIFHLGVYRFSTFRTKCFVRRQEYNSKKTSRRKLFMRNRWVRVPQRISRIWPLIGQKHRLVIGLICCL